jgi:transposase
MSRHFKTVDYVASLDQTVRLGDVLPPDYLARFIADAITQLDLQPLYGRYGPRGGAAYAPEVLLGLLVYGDATGVFSSRKLEQATYDEAQMVLPRSQLQELLDRYVTLWEQADIPGLVALLREDAWFTMPPLPAWV